MTRTRLVPALLVLALTASSLACSGVKPIHKGQTIRCPSCGAEFPVEQGVEAKEKTK